mmetsp:Transcript_50455/g.74068  ORF Transcript_50455/g.74068 Transcript_50455/m.74068 type:complete len:100 (-) Transcript_50455:223-522(-)
MPRCTRAIEQGPREESEEDRLALEEEGGGVKSCTHSQLLNRARSLARMALPRIVLPVRTLQSAGLGAWKFDKRAPGNEGRTHVDEIVRGTGFRVRVMVG